MTLVYDPCPSLKGRRITKRSRPHRRRNKSPSSSLKGKAAKTTTNINQTQVLGEELLDFGNQQEESIPRSTGAIRQLRSHNISSETSLATSTFRSGNRRRQTALAVDTRFIEALQDSDLPQTIIQHIQLLLQKTSIRGVAPNVVSVSQMKKGQNGISCIRVHSYSLCKTLENLSDLEPLYIPSRSLETESPEKQETTNDGAVVVQLPKLLSATASWKLFGDYVVSALQSPVFQESPPCNNLTVLTNDISFLSDTRITVHADGLNEFWDRCKPFFLEHKLNSIEIVVLWTNAEIIDIKDGADTDDKGAEEKAEKNGDDHQQEETELRYPRQTAVVDFVFALNQQLREKGEEEFRANRSNIQFDVTHHIPSIAMSVSIVENSALGMMSLLREWSRKEVPGPERMTLHFPKTSDSSDCNKLALDASYKTIPFALDSELTPRLQNDLKLIAQSKLEVIKSVPIESIDASLLYGVPIRVRTGLQADMESHQAMVQMVQSLFRHISKKEQALMITSSPQPSTESTTNVVGLFHSSVQHTFILMGEEIPLLLRHTVPPSTGILMRLANADHFVEEVGGFNAISTVGENDTNFFSESMEQTLDSIAYSCSTVGLNPMYTSALQARQPPPADQPTKNDTISVPYETRNEKIKIDSEDKWNDNSGVGSSEAAFNAAQELVSDAALHSGAHQPPSRKEPNNASMEKCEPELENDNASELQRPTKTKPIPLDLDCCCQFPRARTGETTVKEEVEWTDDEYVDCFGVGDSPDSDDSDEANSAGVFDYSD